MDRGERREIKKNKWFNKLKKLYYSRQYSWYKRLHQGGSGISFTDNDQHQMLKPSEWKDLMDTQTGVALKETGTLYHNPKTEKDCYSDAKMLHKRDKANKSLSKEDQEDLEECLEEINNPYSFEQYCCACDNFRDADLCPFYDKVAQRTRWHEINCKNFMD